MSEDERNDRIYRCRHGVEAMRWYDTNALREAFAAWFDRHEQMFSTKGPLVALPEGGFVKEGEWILWSDSEMIAMNDDQFVAEYEPVVVRPRGVKWR